MARTVVSDTRHRAASNAGVNQRTERSSSSWRSRRASPDLDPVEVQDTYIASREVPIMAEEGIEGLRGEDRCEDGC